MKNTIFASNLIKMNKLSLLVLILFYFTLALHSQPELKYEDNQTLSWKEAVEFYTSLDKNYDNCKLTVAGETDSGKPLHLFIISGNNQFDAGEVKASGKAVILINNGIHPGEPCGVDASAKFAREILENPEEYSDMLDSLVICIIPVLNVGGALNRGMYHRANQDGPVEHGFRGNSTNMDLNRDFIKLDTKNARSLVKIMREWNPDVLIDTHTSNGADYPYAITLIATQKDKLNLPAGTFLYEEMLPDLYDEMSKTPYEMTPYVMSMDRRNPKNGIVAFMDYPRYTTGYASLFNTIGFTVETHMFKPLRDRVLSTYHFLRVTSKYMAGNKTAIKITRALANEALRQKKDFVLQWKLDTTKYEMFDFKGYEIKNRTSKTTGHQTYYFDRNDSWEKPVKIYNNYSAEKRISTPDFYILPAAWSRAVDLMKVNNVEMHKLKKDTLLEVEYYYIEDFKTYPEAYNGHYFHSGTKIRKESGKLNFLSGDYLIPLNQLANQYIVQVLEPEAVDSWFNWNFFDSILSRKEYFSSYVFDEKAGDILSSDPDLKKDFEAKKQVDKEFAKDHYGQLRYIYERSEYSEKTYKRYPVARFYLDK